MNYVKQILFPDEKVLYDARVHPVILSRGVAWLGLAALVSFLTSHTGGHNSPMLNMFRSLAESFPSSNWLYSIFVGWQVASPNVAFEFKLLSLFITLWGLKHVIRGILVMRTTELVVTDIRIICKMGIFNILTLEMDRRRVAEVLIDQSMWGRMLNYGKVYIRGFTGVIGGMPPLVNPHSIEPYLNMRY